jgi:hypothetical protein
LKNSAVDTLQVFEVESAADGLVLYSGNISGGYFALGNRKRIFVTNVQFVF